VHGSCLLHVSRCELGFTGSNDATVEIKTIRSRAVVIAPVMSQTITLVLTARLDSSTVLTHRNDAGRMATAQSLDGRPQIGGGPPLDAPEGRTSDGSLSWASLV
jgi:hypothetical protein